MKCPKCGGQSCSITTKMEKKGKDYFFCRGLLAGAVFGPLGTYAGWNKKAANTITAYWVCKKCGHKFEA